MHNFSPEEVLLEKKKREEFAKRQIDSWSKDKRLDGLERKIVEIAHRNPQKARLIAERLYKQDLYQKQLLGSGKLTEATFSSTFGVTPERVLKTTLLGTAMSNRPNWMIEQTLQTTSDVYWYIKKTRDASVRGATAGEYLLETENQYYANEVMPPEAVGTGNDVLTNFTMTTSRLPVGYTVRILTNASGNGYSIVAQDDGSGNVTGAALSAGTIDYTTGDLDITFAVAPASGVLIKIEYHYDSEDPSLYDANRGTVSLIPSKVNFRPRMKTIGYSFSDLAQLTYDSVFAGQSMQDDLVTAMAEEMASSRDYEGINTYVRMANSNAVTNFDAKFASYSEVSDELHARKLWDAIGIVARQINDADKRGGSFSRIICGGKASLYAQKDKNFDMSGQQDLTAGSWYVGKRGNIDVYETVSNSTRLAEDEMLLINYNPDSNSEPGCVAGVLTEIEASLRTPDFMTNAQMSRIEDIVPINNSFVRKLKINNIDFSFATT